MKYSAGHLIKYNNLILCKLSPLLPMPSIIAHHLTNMMKILSPSNKARKP